MLPSKGYFKLINCPFFSSDLCHRNYCHFRHFKKEPDITSKIDLTSTINNNKSKQFFNKNFLHQDFVHESNKNTSQTEDTRIENENNTDSTSINYKQIHQTHPLPPNIPHYSPTPISELKTRFKHSLCKNYDSASINSGNLIEQNKYSFKSTQTTDSVVSENSDYIYEGNLKTSLTKANLTNSILCAAESEFKRIENNSEVLNKTSQSTQTHIPINSHVLQELFISEVNKNTHENTVPEETNNDLKKLIKSTLEPNKEQTYRTTTSINTEFVNGQAVNKTEYKRNNKASLQNINGTETRKTSKVSRDNILTVDNAKQKKLKLIQKKSKTLYPTKHKQKHETNIKKKLDFVKNSLTKSNKHEGKKENYKIKKIKSEYLKTYHELVTSEDEISENGSIFSGNSDTNIITISDSEGSDGCTVNNTKDPNSVNDLPQPKKKIRVSHLSKKSNPNSQSDQKQHFKNQIPDKLQDNLPEPKRKIRISHAKLQNEAVSLKSTEEYLLHWKMVRERVKRKCINPSGEEGYQNWSNVKISPVLNVASMLNAKKLLYSKINQWKKNH